MKKLVSTLDLSYEQWLEYRKKSIGGSDCATIIGLNKFKSPYSLWAEKKGFFDTSLKDTEIMRQGRDFEEYVAQRFCEATGKKVRKRNYIFLHNDYDFISANIDREIVGENAGLECKTISIYNKTDFVNGEIPEYYYCQCMHYMSVMGYDKMYLAVLVLSKGFYWFEIKRDEDEIKALIEMEVDWWNRYILGSEIPEIDGSDSTLNAVRYINKDISTDIKDISKLDDVLNEYEAISKQKKFIENKEKELKNNIIAFMSSNEIGNSSKYSVYYKTQKRISIDIVTLKKDLPDICKNYLKESEYRVLKVKTV